MRCTECERMQLPSVKQAANPHQKGWTPQQPDLKSFTFHSQGNISGDRGGAHGRARTGTDGHGRTRPTQPTQPTRPTHPIHPNKTKVQSDPTREEARKERESNQHKAPAAASEAAAERRDRGGRASQLSHARSAGPRRQAAVPPQTRAGSRAAVLTSISHLGITARGDGKSGVQ